MIMKKIRNLIFVLLIAAVCALALVGCGAAPELSLRDDAMPQTVYVYGENLDLSGGRLTVKDGEEITTVDMTAEGVSYSGYNPNQLGEQTVTLTYDGATVSFTVTVVPRMQVVDANCDYLVGDEFDTTKGKLKITRNDGSSYTVVLNSNKVTATGFNSTTAGVSTVTFSYTSGSETYTATLDTNIYAIEDVAFVQPTNLNYKSHDNKIDLTGAKIILSGKGGALSKDIAVTDDMISNFDLGAVNGTNSPLSQKVSVTYLNTHTFTFNITITYTEVSMFIDGAEQMVEFDFSQDFSEDESKEPEISADLGELALHLITLYADMSPAERAIITKSDAIAVARVAMLYGLNIWGEDVAKFEGAFEYSAGQFSLLCESAEAVENAVELLYVLDRPLFSAPPVMQMIVDMFGSDVFFYEYCFEDFAVADAETLGELVYLFEYMLDLHAKAGAIPADWKTVGTLNCADAIENAFNCIMESDYASYAFSQIYYMVSSWRDNDDLFDCMYDYYYNMADAQSLIRLALVRLPSELEEIYSYILLAMENIDYISEGYMYDTSEFFYNYNMAVQLSDAIKNGTDIMLYELYYVLPLNGLLGIDSDDLYDLEYMLDYLRSVEGGYYASTGALLGKADFNALMSKYMAIVMKIFTDDAYEESAAYGTDLEQLLALYIELSPADQYNFLGMLNAYYASNMPTYAFYPYVDLGEDELYDMSCVFVSLLQDYYMGLFSNEDAAMVYVALMVATEAYAQRYVSGAGLELFLEQFAEIDAILEDMGDDDYAVFETKLKYIYDKYAQIKAFVSPEIEEPGEPSEPEEPTEPDLGEWADEFEELKWALMAADLSYMYINEGYNVYSWLISAFERAWSISEKILTEAPPQIQYIYMHSDLYSRDELGAIMNGETDPDTTDWVYWSYDYVVSVYRAVYINVLLVALNGSSAYDYYVYYKMDSFMDATYDLIWAYLWSGDGDTQVFDVEAVHAAFAEYAKLDVAAQYLFMAYIDGGTNIYYTALEAFIEENYTGACADVVTQLISLEIQYVIYMNTYDESAAEYLEEIKSALAELKAAYEDLSDPENAEHKAAFADFENQYQSDIEMIEKAIAAAESSNED